MGNSRSHWDGVVMKENDTVINMKKGVKANAYILTYLYFLSNTGQVQTKEICRKHVSVVSTSSAHGPGLFIAWT